jgi:TolB-like protein/class 3 adenylate cyclase
LPNTGSDSHKSRLATIVVADIVGYSRLMATAEDDTYTTLRTIRSELIDPGVDDGGGRVVKHLGDGFLAEFPSVVASVQFAMALQDRIRLHNEELPEDQQFHLRIGINLGDIIVDEDGDIFGDGVNVAARLESLALPGGICVSGPVRASVHKKIDATFEDLGEQHVKNIPTPLRAYHLHWSGGSAPPVERSRRSAGVSFGELKRRNVFRVAVAYLAAAWLLTEVSSTVLPLFGLPESGVRLIVVLLALGFIPTLVFSWAYEFTPEGLKREEDVVRDASITHVTAKRLDLITIGLIVVALLFVGMNSSWVRSVVSGPEAALVDKVGGDQGVAAHDPAGVSDPDASIAVLPFANRSADPDDAYFVDGIHDDLLTQLSKIGTIRVISRTSVMRYRGTSMSLPEIAAELGVSNVLEGGVQRSGDEVRVNVQLIDARSDRHLWAETYDRDLSVGNLFAIQSEVSEAIAEALHATISPFERQRVGATPTENMEAYEAYLLGKPGLDHGSAASLRNAAGHFEEAVRLDPEFAIAWVALADTYYAQGGTDALTESEALGLARAALDTALALDGDLGEAYTSRGGLKLIQGDYEGAQADLERALELSPNYPPLSAVYSALLYRLGRADESLRWRAKSVQLDPMSAGLRRSYAVALRQTGRIQDAMEQLRIAREIDPDHPGTLDAIATIQWQVFNRLDEAASDYAELIALDPLQTAHYGFLAQLYLDLEEPARARALVKRAEGFGSDAVTMVWGRLLTRIYLGTREDLAEDASAIANQHVWAAWQRNVGLAQLSWRAMEAGRYEDALALYTDHHTDLLGESEPEIGLHNYRSAIDLALVLQRSGDRQRAERLLELTYAFIQQQPRLGWWGGYWVSDVQILALQGRKAEALAALQEAVDDGWRSLWWYYLRHDPTLESIRGEPEFVAAVDQIEADVAAQMRRIREMEASGEMLAVEGVVFESE